MATSHEVNQSIRATLERLSQQGGSGLVAHSTAKALERRGLVVCAVPKLPSCIYQPSKLRATLTEKGRAELHPESGDTGDSKHKQSSDCLAGS